jgi:feruloyl esterase
MQRLTLVALLLFGFSAPALAQRCERLSSLSLPNGTVTLAREDAGACKVAATLKPTSDSEIKIEVWLPLANWNGKLQAVGNGAFNGNIPADAMEAARAGRSAVPRR